MEMIKIASSWGNSSGVRLPIDWKGKQVKVILLDRSEEIKKEVFNIVKDYLEDIIGIYLTGSYARGEQTRDSDIDILVLSNKTNKEITSGKYNVSIYTLESIKKTIESNPVLIYPRIIESKTIMNKGLLEELKVTKNLNYKKYIEETKRIIKINKELIQIDEEKNKVSESIAYSLILRLRGLLLIKYSNKKKILTNKEIKELLEENIGKESENLLESYKRIKNNKKDRGIESSSIKKLLELVEKEIREIDK